LLDRVIAYTDGGSRGNPGPAAAAFILADMAGNKLLARASLLGKTTNNAAEYTAVCNAIEAAREIGAKELTVFSDSELIVKQINGQYRVKSDAIRPFFETAVGLLDEFENWKFYHVTRDKNKPADELVNQALDLGRDIEQRPAAEAENNKTIRLGVLISGGGTTVMNILDYINQGKLNARVAVVISSRSTVAGVERAKKAGLEVKIVRKKDHRDIDEFSKCVEDVLVAANVDLVVQGGWLCLWKIPQRYESRVMNIHPALLPAFGGQGMWGHHVHEAVLKAGCKVSGCTVHFCTSEYDKGPIIVQRACEVKDNDSPDSLAARVFEQECIAFPQAIRLFAEDRIIVDDNRVKIRP